MRTYRVTRPTTFTIGPPTDSQEPHDMSGSTEVVSRGTTYVGGIDYAEGYRRSASVTVNTMPRGRGNRHERRRAAALARQRGVTLNFDLES